MKRKPRTAKSMLLLPPVDWQRAYNLLREAERYDFEQTIAATAVQAARLSAYISRRQSGGRHEDAVKRQNQVARRVRQALGYTYADDALDF